MHILTRPILEIDLNNLLNNYKSLKALSRHAQAAAVVKDDAYGLHADIVAKKLYEEGGCRHFSLHTELKAKESAIWFPKRRFTFCRASAKTASILSAAAG